MSVSLNFDDTQVLLGMPEGALAGADDESRLTLISERFVTLVALQAKTRVYQHRVADSIVDALNAGISPDDVAGAAGVAPHELLEAVTGARFSQLNGTGHASLMAIEPPAVVVEGVVPSVEPDEIVAADVEASGRLMSDDDVSGVVEELSRLNETPDAATVDPVSRRSGFWGRLFGRGKPHNASSGPNVDALYEFPRMR